MSGVVSTAPSSVARSAAARPGSSAGDEVGRVLGQHRPGALEVVHVLGDGLGFALADLPVELADARAASRHSAAKGSLHGFFAENSDR